MLTLFHIKVEKLDRTQRLEVTFGPERDNRPSTAAKLLADGFYEKVATADLNDTTEGLETLYTMTQNGVLTDSWSLLPPLGLIVLEPKGHQPHQEGASLLGRRSTMIGDIVEVREEVGGPPLRRWVVDTFGFAPMVVL